MATVTIEYYGMEGQGRTVTEAKRDAGAKIEKALGGDWTPRLLTSRGWTILLYREPSGWHSAITCDADSGPRTGNVHGTNYRDYEDCHESALAHLGQLSWDGAEMLPPCLQCEFSREMQRSGGARRLVSEFSSWRGFQMAFKYARRVGISTDHNVLHRWACDHAREFSDKGADYVPGAALAVAV